MATVPVRVRADLKVVLASERRFHLKEDHPMYVKTCPACDMPLGGRPFVDDQGKITPNGSVVIVFTGFAPEDRKQSGHATGTGIGVHAECAGVPQEEPE